MNDNIHQCIYISDNVFLKMIDGGYLNACGQWKRGNATMLKNTYVAIEWCDCLNEGLNKCEYYF